MLTFENVQISEDISSILINYLIRSLGTEETYALKGLLETNDMDSKIFGVLASSDGAFHVESTDTHITIKACSPFLDFETLQIDTTTHQITGSIVFEGSTYHFSHKLASDTLFELVQAVHYLINVTSHHGELRSKLVRHKLVNVYCEVLAMAIYRFLLVNSSNSVGEMESKTLEGLLTRGHNHLIILMIYKRMKNSIAT